MKIILVINEATISIDSLKAIALCGTVVDISGTKCSYIKYPPELEQSLKSKSPTTFHLSELMYNIEQEIVMHECAKGD